MKTRYCFVNVNRWSSAVHHAPSDIRSFPSMLKTSDPETLSQMPLNASDCGSCALPTEKEKRLSEKLPAEIVL